MVFNFLSDERFRKPVTTTEFRRNLEEAGRLITVEGNGAGSLEYLKIGVTRETSSF